MLVNAFLAAGKLAAGIAGHSFALIADAIESLSDLFSSIIVWRGVVVASEPADADHPYGHGKAEPIASALVAGMLLLAAGGIVLHSFREMTFSREAPAPFTLAVLLATIVIKEWLFRVVSREGQAIDSSVVQTDAWHHRSDAITSLSAAVGITVALVGGPGFEKADSIAAIVAAGIIGLNGFRLLRGAVMELMDTVPSKDFSADIQRIARETPGVDGIEKCRVRKMGYQYFVDLHVEVDPQMTVQRGHEIAHQVKDRVMANLPEVRDVLIHIEPARSG